MTLGVRLTRWFLANALLAALAFLFAGNANLPMLRVYQVVFGVMGLISLFAINPDLAQERSEPRAEGIDPAVRPVASVLFLATISVAALDIGRLHWACPLSKWAQIAAFVVLIAANVLQIWAMAANPFFSTALRLQTDRGHHLVSHGPYRFVRHPGYLAMLFIVPLTALALGATLALIPASIYGAIILFRAACEDRFLIYNLTGYAHYAEKVRYRLIPGVW
jgi:protein-S-isoprenylcysteine O-methyltransferase Ste14